jgi:hypothetical protein
LHNLPLEETEIGSHFVDVVVGNSAR